MSESFARTEEALVCRFLSMFRTLERDQIKKAIIKCRKKTPEVAEKIIFGMIKSHKIYENGPYLSLIPVSQPGEKKITAFWVLIHFLGRIRIDNFYSAEYPSEINFIMDNQEYSIMVFEPGDYHIFSIAEHIEKIDDHMIYLVATSPSHLDDIPKINMKAYIGKYPEMKYPYYTDAVICYVHYVDKNSKYSFADNDNYEVNGFNDSISGFFLCGDHPLRCFNFHASKSADSFFTEIYVVPRNDFQKWYSKMFEYGNI